MCKTTRTRLTVVAVCMASAIFWTVFALPGSITAKGRPPGAGGGNGQFNTQGFWVWISQDPLGAYFPYGPPPEGSVANGTHVGSEDVVSGDVRDPDDPEMFIHGNATCLVSFRGSGRKAGPELEPLALLLDDDFVSPNSDEVFVACFPGPSWRSMRIPPDGMTVQKHVPGLSLNGKKNLDYLLTIDVDGVDIAGGVWDPLAIAPGDSATLYLGEWTLTTVNPKHQTSGCYAEGDFSNEGTVGTTITVSRWTLDEQAAHDACER